MRRFFFSISIIVLCGCSTSNKLSVHSFTAAKNQVVAHRGAWKKNNLPENSIAALREAIRLGCNGSEFDVRMTNDDSLIINHDPEYNGLKIEEHSFAELSKFKLKNGEPLPTLYNFILAGKKNNQATRFICEIKPSGISKERSKAIAIKSYELFQKLGADNMVAFISFSLDALEALSAINPALSTQYLNGTKTAQELKSMGINGMDYYITVFNNKTSLITDAKANNITLNAWTVNDKEDIDYFLGFGFDYITTNEPELVFERIKAAPSAKGWTLSWSDEFTKKGLPSEENWNYTIGGGGYGNNELQYYTGADTTTAFVTDGQLVITALKKQTEKNAFTSARLNSQEKQSFKYGRIECRAILPAGRGTWPAFWMLGNNRAEAGWPLCGEIDIMEHVGYQADSIYGTIHSKAYNHMIGTQKGKAIFIKNPYTAFHNYSVEWTPEFISFHVDDVEYNRITNDHKSVNEWPFDQPFYLILNLAVGGNWGGLKGVDESVYPAKYIIDYVRVYQKEKY